jgi:hypothetical protein
VAVTITHDNGNQVCFSDRSVYVRMNQTLYGPDGAPVPGVGDIIAALTR